MANPKPPITDLQRNMLRLLERSTNSGDGWRSVSSLLWKLVVEQSHPELTELDQENTRVRFTPEGLIVMKYLP
jgi:hypothetical protein